VHKQPPDLPPIYQGIVLGHCIDGVSATHKMWRSHSFKHYHSMPKNRQITVRNN